MHWWGDNDGRVSRYEARAGATMDCAGLDIRSLNGIEAFVNLRALDCSDNLLDRLDVKNLFHLRSRLLRGPLHRLCQFRLDTLPFLCRTGILRRGKRLQTYKHLSSSRRA